MPPDSKGRFSNRVDDYLRYRPGYPPDVIAYLTSEIGLSPDWTVADIGSGTGLLTQLFLDFGAQVCAVEPNDAMRAACERALAGRAGFTSVAGSAEETTLDNASVDLVAAGQAFHWFDGPACKREFRRILRDGGWVMLVWNTRQVDATPFMRDYEAALVTHGVDYTTVDHRNVDAGRLDAFFESCNRAVFYNAQWLDWDAVRGRLLSSSYAPAPGHPKHGAMMRELRRIFDANTTDGRVEFRYDVEMYVGRV